MSIGKKVTELVIPITVIGGFIGAVQDIISPISKFGIWAGIVFSSLAVILVCIPEMSKPGNLIKKISQHWKTPLIFSFVILAFFTFICTSFSSKSVANGGKGILSDNIKVFSEIQNEVLSLARNTNEVVKDTNNIARNTNDLVKKTQQTVNKTKGDVEIILDNTKMTATRQLAELSYRSGDQNDFFRAIQELSGQELIDVLILFKKAQLKLSRQTDVYPDLFTSNNDRNLLLLRMPKLTNLVQALIYLDYPNEKILTVLNVFEGCEYLKSPVADYYAWQSINPILGSYRKNIIHPQRLIGDNFSDVNISLISYSRKRLGNETKKRGGYSIVHTAAAMGNLELLKELANRGHNLNQISVSGYTPLAIAIERQNIQVAKFLLKRNIDVSTNNSIALEVALLKAIDGYYPFEGAMIPSDYKYLLGEPKDNPYFKLAKEIISKSKSKPSEVISAAHDIYNVHINLVKKEAKVHSDYPTTDIYKEYKSRVQLGERYINYLNSL